MWCRSCSKRPGPTCSCCRTLERIQWIVRSPQGLPAFTSGRVLAILRETSGALQDLFDEVASLPPTPRPEQGGEAQSGVNPPGPGAVSSAAGESPPGGRRGEGEEKAKRSEGGTPATGSTEEQVKKDEVPKKRRKERKDKKERKEPPPRSSPAPVSPPRDGEPKGDRDRTRSNPHVENLRVHGSAAKHFEEKDREHRGEGQREEARGSRPRTPSRSPKRGGEPSRRKHRGSKGVARRERGRAWREGRWNQEWRPKRHS